MQEYERAVIFRLGRVLPGGAKGPGKIVTNLNSYSTEGLLLKFVVVVDLVIIIPQSANRCKFCST